MIDGRGTRHHRGERRASCRQQQQPRRPAHPRPHRRPRRACSASTTTGSCNIIRQVGNYGEIFERNMTADRHPARPERPLDPRRPAVRAADPLTHRRIASRTEQGGRPADGRPSHISGGQDMRRFHRRRALRARPCRARRGAAAARPARTRRDQARGVLACGVTPNTIGFMRADSQGKWRGLDVDYLPRGRGRRCSATPRR